MINKVLRRAPEPFFVIGFDIVTGGMIMIKRCLAILSSLIFITTMGRIYPFKVNAIENIEPVEITSMRSEYEKHYDNGDGTYTAYVDTMPLHYYEDGKWIDIDNTLVLNQNGDYVNKSNSMIVTLSSEATIHGLMIYYKLHLNNLLHSMKKMNV